VLVNVVLNFQRVIAVACLLAATACALVVRGDALGLAPDLSRYEGRTVASVDLLIEEAATEAAAAAELRALLRIAPDRPFAVVQVRESLQALFDSQRVANVRVEAAEAAGAPGEDGRPRVALRFYVRPQVLVNEVRIDIGATPVGAPRVSEDELRSRLNLLEPGRRISEQALKNGADAIQVYLRDRGYYRASVDYESALDPTRTRAAVTYRVALGEPALVEAFNIQINGFDTARVASDLKLRRGEVFTRDALGQDIAAIRRSIVEMNHLAPRIDEPQVLFDSANNRMSVTLTGTLGPVVAVRVEGYEVSEKTQRELLPVLREGTIDFSAIVEGERRLRNRLQEQGYFFAEVNPVCSAQPPLAPPAAGTETEAGATCANIDPEELTNSRIQIVYEVEAGRRFKLTDVRIEGTEKLTVDDVEGDLRTRRATVLGIIPLLGYGRGYTSDEALEQDRRTIEARMRELGYRRANVVARRGVSLEGENLIITFAVEEGALTRVAGVEVRGNQLYTAERLRDERCPRNPLPDETCLIIGGAFSRQQARTDADRIRTFYGRSGYLGSDIQLDVVELPRDPATGDEQVRVIYTVNETNKVIINNIFVNGNVQTKKEAILNAIPLRSGDVLRAGDLAEAERILLNTTDAFRQVIIRTEAAGQTASGYRRRDIIIDIEERKHIVTDYIAGFSTDNGPLGGFELRNTNLFGELKQGNFRSRFSRRQQLVRFEYFDPRFRRYGAKEFAPLTISLQYQRDTSVTRFFRSTIDRGENGIVQRFDAEGNLIDEFGQGVKEPSINRFTINAETQRDIELELGPQGQIRKRSTLFLRYNYEDVRLFNIGSLLVAPLLRPDQSVRLSRFGASFARDTRDRQFDPSRGEFLSVDYALALKPLGGSLSFSKLLTNYRRYYRLNRVRETVLAASVQLGLATLYNPPDRDDNGTIDESDRRLPISERFFSGGSTTLRGFGFEEAGPRFGVLPQNAFFNSNGEPVEVKPFLVPTGGNALAIVNLEARVGLTKSLQAVPFYDGGNVFRRVKDIFKPGCEDLPASDPFRQNACAKWTHTVGLGFRLKTPVGSLGVDYGVLLNPPVFVVPQADNLTSTVTARRTQLHFRFGQTF
jgi:outer membrane protein insertion porin family